MSSGIDGLKVKKDAAVSALFSLYKAAGDASSAVLDLINHLESTGLDVSDLRSAFAGVNSLATPEPAHKLVKVAANASNSGSSPTTPSADAVGTTAAVGTTEDLPSDAVDGAAGKKRAKRTPKDPNAPKRPLNAFLKFRNQESKKISEERKKKGEPDLSRTDLSAAVKERWDNLPESVREAMNQESRAELERYHIVSAEYKESAAQGGEPLTQVELSQPDSSQPVASQQAGSSSQDEDQPGSPSKKKQKRKEDSKKDDKEKKRKKKQQPE